MYHAVRSALADAVTSGGSPRTGSRRRPPGSPGCGHGSPRTAAGPASPADGAVGAGDGIGLVAARRALRRSGPVPRRSLDPLVVEVEPEENIAAGRFPWGFEPWADAPGSTWRPATGAAAGAILAAAAGRSLVLAVRDARSVLPLIGERARGAPGHGPRRDGRARLDAAAGNGVPGRTYGASRVCAQAARRRSAWPDLRIPRRATILDAMRPPRRLVQPDL